MFFYSSFCFAFCSALNTAIILGKKYPSVYLHLEFVSALPYLPGPLPAKYCQH